MESHQYMWRLRKRTITTRWHHLHWFWLGISSHLFLSVVQVLSCDCCYSAVWLQQWDSSLKHRLPLPKLTHQPQQLAPLSPYAQLPYPPHSSSPMLCRKSNTHSHTQTLSWSSSFSTQVVSSEMDMAGQTVQTMLWDSKMHTKYCGIMFPIKWFTLCWAFICWPQNALKHHSESHVLTLPHIYVQFLYGTSSSLCVADGENVKLISDLRLKEKFSKDKCVAWLWLLYYKI